jgi:ectoine hydroxylase-related dioxygenase (phytanoyl-CoA dioxygenase family)
MIPFEEGSLLMFPGWLEHTTDRNRNEDPRTIIGFNVMPIGKTNIDTFDRYNYQSVEGAELVNKIDDLFKPIT